jgi:hypothetical protein
MSNPVLTPRVALVLAIVVSPQAFLALCLKTINYILQTRDAYATRAKDTHNVPLQ